jgi:hypothetical protein
MELYNNDHTIQSISRSLGSYNRQVDTIKKLLSIRSVGRDRSHLKSYGQRVRLQDGQNRVEGNRRKATSDSGAMVVGGVIAVGVELISALR